MAIRRLGIEMPCGIAGGGLLERCFRIPFSELKPLFGKAFQLSRTRFSNVIYFSVPGMARFDTSFYTATDPYRFPSVSVTGERCYLNCEHCRGRILKTMIPATTPERLFKIFTKVKRSGGEGCLVSGGSMEDGSVPLMDFIPVIKRAKKDLGLDVAVHTGIVHPELAEALASADIDAALIDIIGSNETIRRIYHLNLTADAFDHSLSLLERNNIPFVPHIAVGLHYGKLKGEQRALQIVSKHRPAALIFIALMPLSQTPMEHTAPPSPINVARVILAARFMMPETPLILGCARPGGKHRSETDVLAIRAGVSGIAYPSREGYNFAKEVELDVKFSVKCCALQHKDLIAHLKQASFNS